MRRIVTHTTHTLAYPHPRTPTHPRSHTHSPSPLTTRHGQINNDNYGGAGGMNYDESYGGGDGYGDKYGGGDGYGDNYGGGYGTFDLIELT